VVARESWVNYLKRNQSIVVDLFMGQYKSKVTCPTCQHESITFDPYSTLSLPIPQSSAQNSISTFVFAANYRSSTKKLTVEYSGKSISEWRAYTASQLRLNADDLVYYCLAFDDEIEEYCDTTPI
jgi:ubiquitin carboxyl-terminal hydrolase 4/11/15